jgi:hypothetical protein
VPVALDVERPIVAPELHQVHRREVAGGVVEEDEFRAVVDHDAVGHEVARHRLGEVEHVFLAEGVD